MERKMTKVKKGIAAIVLCFIFIICTDQPVKADMIPINVKNGFKEVIPFEPGLEIFYHVTGLNGADKCKIISSNKAVAKIDDWGNGDFLIKLKKMGTTKLTFSGKVKGKTVRRKGTIKVVKFQKPFKSFKIGDKSYLKKISGFENWIGFDLNKRKIKKTTVKYVLNPGWKVMKASVIKTVHGKDEETVMKYSKLKNGKVFSINPNYTRVKIQLKHKKTGMKIYVDINWES